MGLFAKHKKNVNESRGSEGGVYFLPGDYLVEIERCKYGKTRVPEKDFFVAECLIVESTNSDRPSGMRCSFMVTLDKYPGLSLGNIADFMRAGMSAFAVQKLQEPYVDPAAVKLADEDEDDITGEKNVFVGVRLRVHAFDKPKKTKPDEMFTNHKFMVPGAPGVKSIAELKALTEKSATPAPVPTGA